MNQRVSAIAHRRVALLFASIFLALPGCSQDPTVTVTLEISGISAEADRDDLKESLKGMTDGSSHSMNSSWSGDRMTINLSPVSDVDAFVEKINFGTVTDVSGRTVKVDFVP